LNVDSGSPREGGRRPDQGEQGEKEEEVEGGTERRGAHGGAGLAERKRNPGIFTAVGGNANQAWNVREREGREGGREEGKKGSTSGGVVLVKRLRQHARSQDKSRPTHKKYEVLQATADITDTR